MRVTLLTGSVVQLLLDTNERLLIFRLKCPVQSDGLFAISRQLGSTAVFTAGSPDDQWLFCQIIHFIQRIPG